MVFFEASYIPEPNSGCWLWTRATEVSGYGSITVGRGPTKNGNEKAHRFSWRLHKGEIPAGMQVLHRCDVRSCVNPDHLFLGTPKDNYDDMVAKGRKARFDYSRLSPLTRDAVDNIRRDRDHGLSFSKLAKRYGISIAAAWKIARFRSWRGQR
jgi:hypothetical protein